jgi:hypothetical protein
MTFNLRIFPPLTVGRWEQSPFVENARFKLKRQGGEGGNPQARILLAAGTGAHTNSSHLESRALQVFETSGLHSQISIHTLWLASITSCFSRLAEAGRRTIYALAAVEEQSGGFRKVEQRRYLSQ